MGHVAVLRNGLREGVRELQKVRSLLVGLQEKVPPLPAEAAQEDQDAEPDPPRIGAPGRGAPRRDGADLFHHVRVGGIARRVLSGAARASGMGLRRPDVPHPARAGRAPAGLPGADRRRRSRPEAPRSSSAWRRDLQELAPLTTASVPEYPLPSREDVCSLCANRGVAQLGRAHGSGP